MERLHYMLMASVLRLPVEAGEPLAGITVALLVLLAFRQLQARASEVEAAVAQAARA